LDFASWVESKMATEEPFFGFEKIKGAPNLHYYWNGKLIQNLASIFYLLEYMFDIVKN
jgi:hypothetical protein